MFEINGLRCRYPRHRLVKSADKSFHELHFYTLKKKNKKKTGITSMSIKSVLKKINGIDNKKKEKRKKGVMKSNMVEPSGENSPSPFEKCKYKILLVSMARVSDLLLYSLKREHQSLSEASFHYLNFTHCTKQNLRHYRQASSKLSIQQQKKIHLSTGTHNNLPFLHDTVCFTF